MNKTKDGRFIEKRVKIDKKLLRKIMLEIKSSKNYTWKRLSKELKIGEHMIRVDYLKKDRTIPLSMFNQLILLHKSLSFEKIKKNIQILNPFWGQKTREKNFKKDISFPNINSKEFAEFYGIMLGDGCIYSNLDGFCITGHKILEKEYYRNYLKNLIENLFSDAPKFSVSKEHNVIRCYLYSKQISSFLINLGFSRGKKKNLIIPHFFKNKEQISYCIRGLFDTDGSLSNHPGAKIMIHFSIPQNPLRESVSKALKLFNIKFSYSSKSIYIYGKENVGFFFNIIGSSSIKNNYKYKIFKKTGKVPSSKETETFLINKR
jgi:hypothetical protein|tara:strand:+ start:533 stop:1486 length:954 start_codon:yes stop_codon:yes gene_type:complete